MKKKRKKKTTSQYCQVPHQLHHFANSVFVLDQNPGSAPDVPKGLQKSDGMQSCMHFAVKLFGKEVWHAVPDGIQLRTFLRQLTDKVLIHWDTVQVNDELFVHIPVDVGRDSFVALLDYAEEVLQVTRVVVCLDRAAQNFKDLVKAFRFMGFEHIPPGYSIMPSEAVNENSISAPKGFHFLGYDID